MHIDAGKLNEHPSVLHLKQVDGGYAWQKVRATWAKAELSTRKNVWSVHGIGATGVTFILRRQPLGLQDALLWRGRHCFIASIQPYGRNHIQVEAALVVVAQCENKYEGVRFPAIMTEEFRRHEQLEPQAINTIRHVLVTPKCITLKPGKLVEVDGEEWPILTAHLLDPEKNEYIIERVVDL